MQFRNRSMDTTLYQRQAIIAHPGLDFVGFRIESGCRMMDPIFEAAPHQMD
jgi:hypothetical protein